MNIQIVPEQDMEILRKYINSNGVVLIPEKVKEEANISDSDIELITDLVSNDEYSFGGDADIWIDLINSPDHYFFTWLLETKEELKE